MALAQAFVWGDLLSLYQLKPYWETARAFCTLVMTVTDLLLLYALPAMPVRCTGVGKTNVTLHQAAYVNELCTYQSFPLARHFWWFSVLFVCFIYLTNNAWEFIPAVSRRVKSFRKAADVVEDTNMTSGFLKHLVMSTNKTETPEEEKNMKIKARKIWALLDRHTIDSDYVVLTYKIRNALSLAVVFTYSVVLMCLLALHGNGFACTAGNSSFTCVYSSHDVIMFVAGMHLFAAMTQIFIIGWVIYVIKETEDMTFLKRLSRGFGESTLPEHFDDVIREIDAARKNEYEELRRLCSVADIQWGIMAKDYDFFYFFKAVIGADLSAAVDEAAVVMEESGEDLGDFQSYLVNLNQREFPKNEMKLKKRIRSFFMWKRPGQETPDAERQLLGKYNTLD